MPDHSLRTEAVSNRPNPLFRDFTAVSQGVERVSTVKGRGSAAQSRRSEATHVPRSSGQTDRRARNSVTREEVLDAALTIIDSEGMESLSMRRLAQFMDTGPMRAYRHFETKDDLLEALADREAQRIRAIDLEGITEPREILAEVARKSRALLLEHPNLAPTVVSRPLSKATAADDLAMATYVMKSAGFANEQVGLVSAGLTAYTLGFVLYELGQRRLHDLSREELLAYYEQLAVEVDDDALVSAQVAGIRNAVDGDWAKMQFEVGLQAMLDGFWSQRALIT